MVFTPGRSLQENDLREMRCDIFFQSVTLWRASPGTWHAPGLASRSCESVKAAARCLQGGHLEKVLGQCQGDPNTNFVSFHPKLTMESISRLGHLASKITSLPSCGRHSPVFLSCLPSSWEQRADPLVHLPLHFLILPPLLCPFPVQLHSKAFCFFLTFLC